MDCSSMTRRLFLSITGGLLAKIGFAHECCGPIKSTRHEVHSDPVTLMDEFLDILQLPMTALRERIEQEFAENPVLDLQALGDDGGIDYYETADLVVDQSDAGHYDLRLSEDSLPALLIDRRFMELYEDPTIQQRTREYLERKLQKAQRLIETLGRRRTTLKQIAETIFQHQRAFLDHGPGHIAPLSAQQIACEVGADPLTVAKAVEGKQVRTRHGVFGLDCFVLRRPGASNN